MKLNKSTSRYLKNNIHQVADIFALNLTHAALLLLNFYANFSLVELWVFIVFTNFSAILISFGNQQNGMNRSWGYGRHLGAYLRFSGIILLLTTAANYIFLQGKYSALLAQFGLVLLVVGIFFRLVLTKVLHVVRKNGFNYRRAIVVGNPSMVNNLTEKLSTHKHYGYRLLASFTEDLHFSATTYPSVDAKDVYQFLIDEQVDEVFISIHVQPRKVQSLVTFCQLNSIVINITHDFLNGIKLEPMSMRINTGGISPTLTIEDEWYAAMLRNDIKRLFDLIFATTFLLFVAWWLFPIIALLIKIDSPGPVFFTQKRTGLNNREFTCFKFRTMRVNAERDVRQASANDYRITALGRVLRVSNFDELPQFINVILGNMSVVGPRPHMLSHTIEYSSLVDDYNERLWIKPGITGLAQSLGYRGEIREMNELHGRISNDRQYIRNWSLGLDIKIIVATIWNMLSFQRTGA